MKKLFTLLVSGLTFTLAAQPPDADALENVIVEKYYVAGPADVQSGLPLGATTYRVFLDLKPGYKVQQINASPAHPISISAPGGFYNSEFGATFGSDFLPILLNFGTAVLDSYVTIKASTQSKAAITKPLDTDGSLLTGDGGFLQNNDPNAGIPLLQADGFIPIDGTVQSVSQIGLGNTLLSEYFGLANSAGTNFESDNGSWFNLEGIKADTEENLVCIGQFTTLTCEFSFKLNLQIIIPEELWVGFPPEYAVIRFVAETHPEDADLNASGDNFYIYQKDFLNFSVTAEECIVSARNLDPISDDWSLMPNPTSEQLNLLLSKEFQDVSYAIYDMSGKLLQNTRLGSQGNNAQISVNVENLEAGIYMIQLRTGDSVSTKKFIVAR